MSGSSVPNSLRRISSARNCPFFARGRCRIRKCGFKHDGSKEEDRRHPPPVGCSPPKQCRNYAKNGTCAFGDSCRFSHSVRGVHPKPRTSPDSDEDTVVSGFLSNESTLSESNDEEAPMDSSSSDSESSPPPPSSSLTLPVAGPSKKPGRPKGTTKNASTSAVSTLDKSLPPFDPTKFRPGYTPSLVRCSGKEYAIVVTGVRDTGLCGSYWGDEGSLPPRRRQRGQRSKSPPPSQQQENHFESPQRKRLKNREGSRAVAEEEAIEAGSLKMVDIVEDISQLDGKASKNERLIITNDDVSIDTAQGRIPPPCPSMAKSGKEDAILKEKRRDLSLNLEDPVSPKGGVKSKAKDCALKENESTLMDPVDRPKDAPYNGKDRPLKEPAHKDLMDHLNDNQSNAKDLKEHDDGLKDLGDLKTNHSNAKDSCLKDGVKDLLRQRKEDTDVIEQSLRSPDDDGPSEDHSNSMKHRNGDAPSSKNSLRLNSTFKYCGRNNASFEGIDVSVIEPNESMVDESSSTQPRKRLHLLDEEFCTPNVIVAAREPKKRMMGRIEDPPRRCLQSRTASTQTNSEIEGTDVSGAAFQSYDALEWASSSSAQEGAQSHSATAIRHECGFSLGFHRLRGHSRQAGIPTGPKKTVCVVIEGRVSIEIGSGESFMAHKGDSILLPAGSSYSLLNDNVREAELGVFKFP